MVGNLHVHSGSLRSLKHLLAYSDGFAKLDQAVQANSCSDEAISKYIEDASFQPNSDDISMFEWWSSPPVFDAPLDMPKGLLYKEEEQDLDVRWEPEEGATRYEINLRNRDRETVAAVFVEVLHHCFQADVYQKGANQLCIRAFRNDEPGEWYCTNFANRHLLSAATQTQTELPVQSPPKEKVAVSSTVIPAAENSSSGIVTPEPPPVTRSLSGTGQLSPPSVQLSQKGRPAASEPITEAPPFKQREVINLPKKNRKVIFLIIIFVVFLLFLVLSLVVFRKFLPTQGRVVMPPNEQISFPTMFKATPTYVVTLAIPSPANVIPGMGEAPPTAMATETIKPTPTVAVQVVTTPEPTITITIKTVNWVDLQPITKEQLGGLQSLPISLPNLGLVEKHPELAENFPQPTDLQVTNLNDNPSSNELAVLALFINQTTDPASPFAALYENQSGMLDQWKFVQELSGARVAAIKGKRFAIVGPDASQPEPEESVQLWDLQGDQWKQYDSLPQKAQDVCALAFDDFGNLFILENTWNLTTYTSLSAEAQSPTKPPSFPLISQYQPQSNQLCSLAVRGDVSNSQVNTLLAASIGGDYWFGQIQNGQLILLSNGNLTHSIQSLAFLGSDGLLRSRPKNYRLDLQKTGEPIQLEEIDNLPALTGADTFHFGLNRKVLVTISKQGEVVFWYTAPKGQE